jgi:diguanylate cyclase (GGDEF)-like protein
VTAGHLIVGRDVTDHHRMEKQLAYMAYHDGLTGLPNRGLFIDRLRTALARGKRNNTLTAVVFLDLDQFKEINDIHGHMEGDNVLRDVAARLGATVRESDTVARFGGDEFAFVFSDMQDHEHLQPLIQRIHEQFHVPFLVAGNSMLVTASLGVSVAPEDGDTLDQLMRHADIAMYVAKGAGGDSVQRYQQASEPVDRDSGTLPFTD